MGRLPVPADDRLDSWKEIAAYLNRSVRTARRWEREEGLPVHRQVHRTLGSVYAYRFEIEAWRRTDARRTLPRASAREASRQTKSIAVLPFANLSIDPDNAYFADGLTDEVTADLSKVLSLRVTSRTSAMVFKNTTKDVRTIARELGVGYVLEGSVRRADGRLRITAQLIDATTDGHIWADKFAGFVEDVFDFQERLARVIVEALKLRLSSDEERRLAERPIADLRAYECYLRARQEAWRWRKDAIDGAIQLLHQALRIAGENAEIYAALGMAHLQYRDAAIDVSEQPLHEAELFAKEVDRLGPNSASGMRLHGWIHYASGRVQEAVQALKAALQLDTNNADTLSLLSNCYLISGKVEAARSLIERLLAIDPLTPLVRCLPGFADAMEGRFSAALEPYRTMFQMDTGNPVARLFYGWVLAANGLTADVATIFDGFSAEARECVPARLAIFLMRSLEGNAKRAQAIVSPEIKAVAEVSDVYSRILASGYAAARMPERAMDWLEIAVARGFINYPYLAYHDPFLQSLRKHPRFVALMKTTQGRWEKFVE